MQPIDFDHAWEDQDDLDSLCRDRPLETREILVQNAFYGSDHVLKAHAGLPARYPLKMVIPHGIILEPANLSFLSRLERLPIVTYSRGDGEQLYREAGIRNTLWPLAMPFVYAVDLTRRTAGRAPPRRGTIFFPAHSIPSDVVDHDVEAIASRLRELPQELHPVTVCVF